MTWRTLPVRTGVMDPRRAQYTASILLQSRARRRRSSRWSIPRTCGPWSLPHLPRFHRRRKRIDSTVHTSATGFAHHQTRMVRESDVHLVKGTDYWVAVWMGIPKKLRDMFDTRSSHKAADLNHFRLVDHLVNFVSFREPPRPLRPKAGSGRKKIQFAPQNNFRTTIFSQLHNKISFLSDWMGKNQKYFNIFPSYFVILKLKIC